jgi:hypothetical protein
VPFLHGVRRLDGGGVRVRLSAREHEILSSLPDQLRPLLGGKGDGEAELRVRARLFPPAYEDRLAEEDYRDLVGAGLSEERLAAVETFARTLARGSGGRLGWSADLTADEASAWLSATNDARLTLGVLLGITTEAEWEAGPDHANASSILLYYLGWLQEELIAALLA